MFICIPANYKTKQFRSSPGKGLNFANIGLAVANNDGAYGLNFVS
jgi:hypothetical protein